MAPPGAGLEADIGARVDGFALDLRLSVAPGERVAIVGANGAGKTTLLRVVAGLVRLASGRLRAGGRVLDDPAAGVFVPPEERSVGYVFQDRRLFPHLRVEDDVAFGLRARGAARAAARTTARTWLGRLGAAGLAHRRTATLSGGEAQRVAIARALAPGPAVLLLDEPFSGLDADARRALRETLAGPLGDFPGPMLLVTHDAEEAGTLAHRVVELAGGRLRA